MDLRIKELREAKGLSMTDLAKLVGVNRCTVSLWESGDRDPMLRWIPILARALGVSPRELFPEEDRDLMSPGA